MPMLINYSGSNSSLLFSTGSHVDVYFPPRKRFRVTAPFIFRENNAEQDNQPFIELLPDECLYEIFRRLHGNQERRSVALVSKRWLMLHSSIQVHEYSKFDKKTPRLVENDVATITGEDNNDGYLTRCLEGNKATDVRLAAIAVGTSSRGGLGKLTIRGTHPTRGVTNLGLTAIAHGCPALKSLSLWNISLLGDEGILEIANRCPQLEKLDLCLCPLISNKGLIAIAEKCPSLISLSIESCSRIGNPGLQAIGRSSLKLQSISIKDCPLIDDHGVGSLLSSVNTVLSKVRFQCLGITNFSLAIIGHYGKAITSLVLSDLKYVSEKGFWVMGNAHGLQKLSSLSITSCPGISDVSLESIAKACPNLKQMSLRKCCFISDNGLVAFSKASRSIQSFQLEECYRVTQKGIFGIISNGGSNLKSLAFIKCLGIKNTRLDIPMASPCVSLKSLSIKNCPGFCSSNLAMLGKLCPQLQHLDLSGIHGITNDEIIPFLESFKAGLQTVNLSGCFNISDEVVFALAKMHGETLKVLNLGKCSKITDASLLAVADNCLKMNDLDVSKCAITDYGVCGLSRSEQRNLQVFSLSGCSKLSDKCLQYLCKLGKTLVGLNIQHCNSISSSTVGMLMENLRKCDVLS